jgi:large subunit ribosomal protein L32e
MGKKVKGWPQSPKVGYRGPRKTRGLHPSGYEEILVYNIDGVERAKPETQVIRIAHTVGARKRVEIRTRADELGIHVLNPGKKEKREQDEEIVDENSVKDD